MLAECSLPFTRSNFALCRQLFKQHGFSTAANHIVNEELRRREVRIKNGTLLVIFVRESNKHYLGVSRKFYTISEVQSLSDRIGGQNIGM